MFLSLIGAVFAKAVTMYPRAQFNHFRLAVIVYTFVMLTVFAPMSFGSAICSDLFVSGEISITEITRKLHDAGYDDLIIERIIGEHAELLKKIATLEITELRPIIFYRGLNISPKKYDPSLLSKDYAGQTFASQRVHMAHFFGTQNAGGQLVNGTLLKYQIPLFMIPSDMRRGQNVAEVIPFPPESLPELFITHIGLIKPTIINPNWIPYANVIRDIQTFRAQFPDAP